MTVRIHMEPRPEHAIIADRDSVNTVFLGNIV
jgi:hypothetical protein